MNDTYDFIAHNSTPIGDDLPKRFQVSPWGRFMSNLQDEEGEMDTLVDDESAKLLIAAHNARGIDGRIDYNHQSEDPKRVNGDRPPLILGYYKSLAAVPGDGIYAEGVEWTPPGADLVKNRQLRYPSFAGRIRRADNRAAAITSVALTQNPFVDGIKSINSGRVGRGSNPNKESPMKTIVQALGLSDGADEATVLNAINKRGTDATTFRTSVCTALGVKPDAKDDDVVAAANAATAAKSAKPAVDAVPRAEFDAVANSLKTVSAELAATRKQLTDAAVEERIAKALNSGKLTPAMVKPDEKGENEFRTLARDGTKWEAFIEKMPVVASPNGRVANSGAAAKPAAGGDAIVMNAAKFDPDGMERYQRIDAYAKENKIPFAKAAELVGAA